MGAGTAAPLRVLEARALAARRTLRSAVVSAFLNPLLYIIAMGLGIGAVVDPAAASALPGGSYISFLAPGLLVATAMQLAATESMWPVMVGLEWERSYHAMTATPLAPRDVVLGHVGWVLVRVTIATSIIATVIAVLGAAPFAGAMAAVPVALLVSAAFAGAVTAFTLTVRAPEALTAFMRFGLVPLFLFSGTFFPIDRLPEGLQLAAAASPLWHGAELARGAALGVPTAWPAAAHATVLVVLAVVGTLVAVRALGRVLRR